MGNGHGHSHRRFGNAASHPRPSAFKYGGPSDQMDQAPSSASGTHMEELSLPYTHVDSSLRALASQAQGFGRFAVGGLHGSIYHVTTLAGNIYIYIYYMFTISTQLGLGKLFFFFW